MPGVVLILGKKCLGMLEPVLVALADEQQGAGADPVAEEVREVYKASGSAMPLLTQAS